MDDHQPAAATRARKASRVPGDTGEAEHQPAAAADDTPAVEETAGRRFVAIPDFRHKSAAAAAKWFKENPDATKRGVLTAEGWYVHPESFKTKAES